MSLHDELLNTARSLVRVPSPTDGDLRRAISTAYYALFHRLVDAAVNHLLPTHADDQRAGLGRAFEHTKMRDICQRVGTLAKQPNPTPNPPSARILGSKIPVELRNIAACFVELQQRRSEADYDRVSPLPNSFKVAQDAIKQVETAFADWTQFEASEPVLAQAFLVLLLTGEPKAR